MVWNEEVLNATLKKADIRLRSLPCREGDGEKARRPSSRSLKEERKKKAHKVEKEPGGEEGKKEKRINIWII